MKKYNFNQIKELKNGISGVYAIVNELNGHKYIGSSKDIKNRWYQHRSKLKNNKHHSPHLQNAYNKYGEHRFYFCVLETCENVRNTILFLEQKYLNLNPEYNSSKVATCPINILQSKEVKLKRAKSLTGKKRTVEQRKRLSNLALEAERGKPVNCYDLNGNYIKTFKSARLACRELNDIANKGVTISQCCKGKTKLYKNMMWRYDNGNYSKIQPYTNNSMKVFEQSKRAIQQLDDYGKIINEFKSISDAARYLGKKYAISNIARCAKGYTPHAAGFRWKYKNKITDYEEV